MLLNSMQKKQQIRNSTAEFLIFAMQGDAEGIEVRLEDDTVWLTQQMLAELYGTTKQNVSSHILNIYAEEELSREATVKDFLTVRNEGARTVTRYLEYYNLDVIIAVGYRVNSKRATQFRQWATAVLRDFAIRGYVLDRKRMENGKFLGQDYFEHMRLTTWEKAPHGKIVKTDVVVSKNYLKEEDWARHLDRILQADDRELLQDAGRISAEIAKEHAENEFEKYRVTQDRLFKSDFDRQMELPCLE